MKITADVRDYAAGLTDNEKAALYPQEAGSAAGATGTKEYAKQGMEQMSKKFMDMGAEVYVDKAEAAKEGNKAL